MKFAVLLGAKTMIGAGLLKQMEREGMEPLVINVPGIGGDLEHFDGYQTWKHLLDELLAFGPDAVVSVNRKGIVGDSPIQLFCELFRIPMIVWWMDDPRYFKLEDYERDLDCQMNLVFDREHIKPLRDWGARHVDVLTVCSDPEKFMLPESDDRLYPISFVGSLGINMICNLLKGLEGSVGERYSELKPEVHRAIEDGGKWLVEHPLESPFVYMAEIFDRDSPVHELKEEMFLITLLIDLQATFTMRITYVKRLLPLGIHVWGDDTWKLHVPADRFHGRISWHDVSQVYQKSRIVLDVPRFQILSAPTQRHFDVPLCGAMLLSKDHKGLMDYFKPGERRMTYNGLDGLEEKAAELLSGWEDLKETNEEVRQGTLSDHTFANRLREIEQVAADHGAWLKETGLSELGPELTQQADRLLAKWIEGGEHRLAEQILDRLDVLVDRSGSGIEPVEA